METADFDYHSFEQNQQSEEDKSLLVKFFVKPKQDKAKSMEEGRPIFKDVEYIDIRIPGDRTGGVCRPASFTDKQRFAPNYAAFKQRTEMPMEGTPLIEWPIITRSLAEELSFHNVKTVEQLSTMADVNVGKFMALGNFKAKAIKWLEQSSEESKVHELQDQLAERDERIDRLEAQMKEFMAASAAAVIPDSSGQDPAPIVETAPSLSSELDEPVPTVKKAVRRRRRVKKDDAKVQNDK